MLLLLADMISLLASPPSQEQICAGRELVSYVISRRLKVRHQNTCSVALQSSSPFLISELFESASAFPMHCRALSLTRSPHSPLPPKKTHPGCLVVLQALYFYLSSDSKPKTCAALVLLSAVARHSVQSARQLAQAFDFSLSALAKLCRLPRYAWHLLDTEDFL